MGFGVLDFGFWVSGFGFRVSGFELRISGFAFHFSSVGVWVSDFGSRVSGLGFQAPSQNVADSCELTKRHRFFFVAECLRRRAVMQEVSTNLEERDVGLLREGRARLAPEPRAVHLGGGRFLMSEAPLY